MRLTKIYAFISIMICCMLLISGCFNINGSETESQHIANNDESSEQYGNDGAIVWDEVFIENGVIAVDEESLIKNTDEETIGFIARQFQDLCEEIDEKGNKDKNYWLTGQWYSDVMESEQYTSVVSLGDKAVKPLFLIIYKSNDSGLYEWICSKALEEISGFDFSEENNGNGWSNSKEFLELYLKKITEHRN